METNGDYAKFLEGKSQADTGDGFSPVWMPDFLYDFQQALVEWAIRKGRGAIYADCGLGKSPIQLVWAENVIRKTNKNALIIAPLAVSNQIAREGEKFGIEVGISRDGKPAGKLTVINYERLHKADPADYIGAVCDECFPFDTKVDTLDPLDNSLRHTYIKDIRPGDTIPNASGVDHVKRVWKRQVYGAVRIRTQGFEITCSENHPFFTLHGWKSAKDLQPSDCLMATGTAMCVVRGGVPAEVLGIKASSVLREVLLSEMADEPPKAQSEGPHRRDVSQDTGGMEGVAGQSNGGRKRGHQGTAAGSESVIRTIGKGEDFQASKRDRVGPASSGRERAGDDGTATGVAVSVACNMEARARDIAGNEAAGIPNVLQGRSCQRETQDSDRGGWPHPPGESENPGSEEGRETSFARVDSVEVLELGHPDLDRYRDEAGDVYFYDLEATRHPSFSVCGVLVHNSSVLKHWSGKTQKAVTRFLSKMPYRLLCTATPAPNDFVELGTSSEALGHLNHSSMLETFFRQISDTEKKKKATADDIIHSKRLSWRVIQSIGQWALKAHAFEPFWKWVALWARACRKPSDLGPFDDSKFILPPLNRFDHTVIPRNPPPGYLFTIPAFGLNQERAERKRTIPERVELVQELTQNSDRAIIWCQLNDEGDALEKAIPDAIQVKGTQSIDQKEELLGAFMNSEARVLITKAKIAGLGLNMQHCAHVITFVTHSYESYYQSIRRCWRFGQKRPVRLDVISTEGEVNVRRNMERKEKLAAQMFESIVAFMNDSQDVAASGPTEQMETPKWM